MPDPYCHGGTVHENGQPGKRQALLRRRVWKPPWRPPIAFDEARILCLIGEIKMIEDEDATKDLKRSVEIFSSLGRKYELATAMTQLGQAHLKLGNKEDSEKYFKQSKEIF